MRKLRDPNHGASLIKNVQSLTTECEAAAGRLQICKPMEIERAPLPFQSQIKGK
jgi:hypothetical protein